MQLLADFKTILYMGFRGSEWKGGSACRLSVKISLLCRLSVKMFELCRLSVNLSNLSVASRQFFPPFVGSQ